MAKLSVIIPVYNTEKYIKKCLDSVINQTLKDIEIIIINDGSTDDSKNIIKTYIDKYENIRLIDKVNEGAAVARNIGIENASGKYITFLDSDDYIEKHMYKEMVDILEIKGADIVQCGIEFVEQDTEKHIKYFFNKSSELNSIQAMKLFLSLKITGYSCNSVYDKNLFKNNNILYPNEFCYEDMEVMLRCMINSKKVIIIEDCYYKYRQVTNSLSKTISDNHIKAYIRQLKEWIRIIEESEKVELKEYIITFKIYTFMSVIKWYIEMNKFNRKKIYSNFDKYFKDVEPNISVFECIKNKNISKGFKLVYCLWKLKIYDIFMKYHILELRK